MIWALLWARKGTGHTNHIAWLEKAAHSKRLYKSYTISQKKIDGWNVQRVKDGYYRCYRKIRGRVKTLYIGKVFNEEKARDRIIEKEKEFGLYKSYTN